MGTSLPQMKKKSMSLTDGSITDVIINYTALLLSFISLVYMLENIEHKSFPFFLGKRIWFPLTIFLIAFQIVLCLIVQCTGISIIWCSLSGFTVTNIRPFFDDINQSKRTFLTGGGARNIFLSIMLVTSLPMRSNLRLYNMAWKISIPGTTR
eukprot:gene4468-8898_t